LRPGRAPSPANLASTSCKPDSALLILPKAEICDCVVLSSRLIRFSVGARSAATSWVTIVCTSRPEPTPGLERDATAASWNGWTGWAERFGQPRQESFRRELDTV